MTSWIPTNAFAVGVWVIVGIALWDFARNLRRR